MKPVTFDNIPSRDEFMALTIECMNAGIANTDKIREIIAQKYNLIVNDCTNNWKDSPSGKFVNEHAWVVVQLQRDDIIEKVSPKQYRITAK